MDVQSINDLLVQGKVGTPGVLPHLEALDRSPLRFDFSFGLAELPQENGILLIRGPRQYGKSTWLEMNIRNTVAQFGPGSALYLNGDELAGPREMAERIRTTVQLFPARAGVKRLFIDEITAVQGWERAVKRLVDAGELSDCLVVTTGSRATDIRRGAERLPGRKGKLERTSYYFAPLPYSEFRNKCVDRLGADCLPAYLLSGGSPVAARELALHRSIPEYVVELTQDWIFGEIVRSGRNRASLISLLHALYRVAPNPTSQLDLARAANLANNTIAADYIEHLSDLMVVRTSHQWDPDKKSPRLKKAAKYHFVNCLAALAWHPARIRRLEDLHRLTAQQLGAWYEWAAAQELWRRAVLESTEGHVYYWQSKQHEIDFIATAPAENHYEIKAGKASPSEFLWFPKTFPHAHLTVVSTERFETGFCTGITMEDFLLERG